MPGVGRRYNKGDNVNVAQGHTEIANAGASLNERLGETEAGCTRGPVLSAYNGN